MGLERRGRAGQIEAVANSAEEEPPERSKQKVKSFDISKRLVFEAWEKVRSNGGAPGVDAVSIDRFGERERDNLYKLWNRMASGSYFPGPVRAVEIPKDHGGPGGRRESHPPAPTEPCVSLSTYTARAIQPQGRAPARQWANRTGSRSATASSHAHTRFLDPRSRLYFFFAHRSR